MAGTFAPPILGGHLFAPMLSDFAPFPPAKLFSLLG
jgi:hypothetical protein